MLTGLRPVNLFYAFEETALAPRNAARTWLIYEGRAWTWPETYDMVLRYAVWLQRQRAVQPGETVALDFTNRPTCLFLLLALWSLGAVPALINTNVTGGALVHSLRVAEAALVVVDEEVAGQFTPEVMRELEAAAAGGEVKEPFQCVFLDGAAEKQIEGLKGVRPPDSVRAGAGITTGFTTALLTFTSGTTGLPKAAICKWHLPSVEAASRPADAEFRWVLQSLRSWELHPALGRGQAERCVLHREQSNTLLEASPLSARS